jgi:hypothetical protein
MKRKAEMVPRPRFRWCRGNNGWRYLWLGNLWVGELLEEPGGFWGGRLGGGRDKLKEITVATARKAVEKDVCRALGWEG